MGLITQRMATTSPGPMEQDFSRDQAMNGRNPAFTLAITPLRWYALDSQYKEGLPRKPVNNTLFLKMILLQ